MTRTTRFVTTAALAALALTLSACSDDSDTDTPSDPSSNASESSSSQTTQFEPKDRSEAVFGEHEKSKVLGSATGKATLGVGSGDIEMDGQKVTFEVTGVTASDDATVLHYQLVADEATAFRMRGEFWYDQPSLRMPGSDVRLQSLTVGLPGYKGVGETDICACTAVYSALTEPQPQSVVFPPLPKDANEVDVILQGLDPVTVPVTR